MNESSKNLSMRSTKILLVKKEYELCHLSLKEIIYIWYVDGITTQAGIPKDHSSISIH